MPDELSLHSALVALQYGNIDGLHLGETLPRMIQPGSCAVFNIPRVALEQVEEVYGVNLAKAHIHVYFAARRRLVAKKSVRERMGKSAATAPSRPASG